MDKKFRHLQFIQGVINRLASNSFQMKGWSVVLVAAILVLLARKDHLDAAPIALGPVLIFWGLDGYFLWQERLFRALYDHVRVLDDEEINFSMDITSFKMGYNRTWCSAWLSRTLLLFYGALALTIVLTMIFNQPNRGDEKWREEFSSAFTTSKIASDRPKCVTLGP